MAVSWLFGVPDNYFSSLLSLYVSRSATSRYTKKWTENDGVCQSHAPPGSFPPSMNTSLNFGCMRMSPELILRVFVWKRFGTVNTVRTDSAGYEKREALFFGIVKFRGHNPSWNKMHPLINKEAGSSGSTAWGLFNPAKDRKGRTIELSDKWLQSRQKPLRGCPWDSLEVATKGIFK